jgi:hypothetical protein
MDRIIIEMITGSSILTKATEQFNRFEQLAIEMGYIKKNAGNRIAGRRYGISEQEMHDMRMKMAQETQHGEILKICRQMMTQETFEKILNDLLKIMRQGHDV